MGKFIILGGIALTAVIFAGYRHHRNKKEPLELNFISPFEEFNCKTFEPEFSVDEDDFDVEEAEEGVDKI